MAKYKTMGANSSYKAMHDIVEQTKEGTILIPDDFTTCGTPDAVRSGLSRLCRNGLLYRFAKVFTIDLCMTSGTAHCVSRH